MAKYIKLNDVYKMLHHIGGCGAEPDSWADGWDKAIDTAIKKLEDIPVTEISSAPKPNERQVSKGMYIEIPDNINRTALEKEFGINAALYYLNRIKEREQQGHYYPKPFKTAYIWAAKDRQSNQGYYSSWRGFNGGRKKKNFGGT